MSSIWGKSQQKYLRIVFAKVPVCFIINLEKDLFIRNSQKSYLKSVKNILIYNSVGSPGIYQNWKSFKLILKLFNERMGRKIYLAWSPILK